MFLDAFLWRQNLCIYSHAIWIRCRFVCCTLSCTNSYSHLFVESFVCIGCIRLHWYVNVYICRMYLQFLHQLNIISFIRARFVYFFHVTCTYIIFWAQSIASSVCIFAFSLWLCSDDVQHNIKFVYWCGFLQDCKINIIFMFGCKRFDFDLK